MNGTCVYCGESRESDGYCEQGCELYVGSVHPATDYDSELVAPLAWVSNHV